MARSRGGANRFDPYKKFTFRVKWDGRHVAGFGEVSGLKADTDPVEYREGRGNMSERSLPGSAGSSGVTLKHGVTHDEEFEKWASTIRNARSGRAGAALPAGNPRDILIEILNEEGQKIVAYRLLRCWVTEYAAVSKIKASGNDVAIESLTLENEGWERVYIKTEATRPVP